MENAPSTALSESEVLNEKLVEQTDSQEVAEAILEDVLAEESEIIEPEESETSEPKKAKKSKKRTRKKRKKIKRLKKTKWRVYAQTLGGAGYSIKELNDPRNTSNSPFEIRRKETETSLETLSGGFNFQFAHRGGLVLSSGLNYRQINERFDYRTIKSTTGLQRAVVAIIVNSAGDTIGQDYGMVVRTTTIEQGQKAYNSYRFINAPIGIGYHKSGRKSGYKIMGGIDLNLYFSMEGVLMTSEGNPTVIDPGVIGRNDERIFNPKVKPGYWLTYEYYRKLNSKISWMIAPRIELPGGSLTQPDYALTQKYYTMSLMTGVNFLLSPKGKKARKKKVFKK